MDNSLKRATALMAVVLMLTGCSSQDNKSNNHSTDDARLMTAVISCLAAITAVLSCQKR